MGVVFHVPTFAAAGAAFLLAVLWFDLMFDVQSRGHRGDPLGRGGEPRARVSAIPGPLRSVSRNPELCSRSVRGAAVRQSGGTKHVEPHNGPAEGFEVIVDL